MVNSILFRRTELACFFFFFFFFFFTFLAAIYSEFIFFFQFSGKLLDLKSLSSVWISSLEVFFFVNSLENDLAL